MMPDAPNSDQAFIPELTDIVLKNLKNEDFGINDLAREARLSSSTLNRRLRRIAGKSGNQFIREIRLRKAHEMLQKKSVNVSEVSYAVGFSSPAYFSACFHEFFGYPPRDVTREGGHRLPDEKPTAPAGPENRINQLRKFLKINRPWILSSLVIAIGVIIVVYIKFLKQSPLDDLRSHDGRISVAVMPFNNLTGNRTWDCMQINLIGYLSNFDELTVRHKESVDILLANRGISDQASITPTVAGAVSRKLDSKIYVSGVISRAGDRSRVTAQLVNSRTREVIKSFQVEDYSDDYKIFGIVDSVSEFIKNFLVTEKMSGDTDPDLRPYRYTNSPVAFEYFIKADDAMKKGDISQSLSLYHKTVEADSSFIPAIIFLAMRNEEMGDYDEARKWCMKAYSKKDHAQLKDRYMIEWYHAVLFGTPEEEVRFLKQYTALDDNVPIAFWMTGDAYSKLWRYADAIPEFEKALKIYKNWDIRPMQIWMYLSLIDACHRTGNYKKAKRMTGIAAKAFPEESWILLKNRALLAYAEGDTAEGNRYVDEYRSEMKARSVPAAKILTEIASIYTESDNMAEAEKSLREACSMRPDDPSVIRLLAYLLIDRELNVAEGLLLAEAGLKINPDDPYLRHTLGWGLAKSGRYEEALAILNESWDARTNYDNSLFQHISEVKRLIPASN